MATPLEELILQRLYAREASFVNHANALDQKASYLLVAITFLAGQISILLAKPKLANWHWELFASGLALGGATTFVVLGTRLLTLLDEGASRLEPWVQAAKANGYDDDEILEQLRQGSCNRLNANQNIFTSRSRLLEIGFYCTVTSLVLNLVALLRATV